MRRIALVVLFLTLAAVLAQPVSAVERLLVPQMPGWKVVVGHADPAAEITELIPDGDDSETWTRRISVEAFRGVAHTVPNLLETVAKRTAEICEDSSAESPRMGRLERYDAGSRFVACGHYKGDGTGSYTLYYAIRGRDAFYVVSRSWRGQPFTPGIVPVEQRELADWIAFMRAIALCDTADPARACPPNSAR